MVFSSFIWSRARNKLCSFCFLDISIDGTQYSWIHCKAQNIFRPKIKQILWIHTCQGHTEWEQSDPEWSEITPEWKEVDNKVGEQPWPQLVCYASICCRACGCVFQEDWIVARSLREKWYRLIGVRIGQGEDVNDFNLQTKELECNYWSTYTKSGIGGVLVTSLHRDPIGVDNRSLGAKN